MTEAPNEGYLERVEYTVEGRYAESSEREREREKRAALGEML